jgi:hypothetical protein
MLKEDKTILHVKKIELVLLYGLQCYIPRLITVTSIKIVSLNASSLKLNANFDPSYIRFIRGLLLRAGCF